MVIQGKNWWVLFEAWVHLPNVCFSFVGVLMGHGPYVDVRVVGDLLAVG